MAYPERKPIYDAYKQIIEKIISEKHWKSFADSEIDGLDASILQAFKEIRIFSLENKQWPEEKF